MLVSQHRKTLTIEELSFLRCSSTGNRTLVSRDLSWVLIIWQLERLLVELFVADSRRSVDAYAEIIATRPLGIWCTAVHQWMRWGLDLGYISLWWKRGKPDLQSSTPWTPWNDPWMVRTRQPDGRLIRLMSCEQIHHLLCIGKKDIAKSHKTVSFHMPMPCSSLSKR
jgi:hypothetical protein